MAGSKVLQFFLLISFVIFSTHALRVLLTDGDGDNGFQYETTIEFRIDAYGVKHFIGCAINKTYHAGPATKKVIVYIKSNIQMARSVLRKKCRDTRVNITQTLIENNYELLYLGVTNFKIWDELLIGDFLRCSIKSNPDVPQFRIETIGQDPWDKFYGPPLCELDKYQEEEKIFGRNLLGKLKSMDQLLPTSTS